MLDFLTVVTSAVMAKTGIFRHKAAQTGTKRHNPAYSGQNRHKAAQSGTAFFFFDVGT
ncbi:hypothetical protein [Chitinophaga skermanii]|uniref:hypothetical protein n=1 Tax=Chitinophaga skermanii TaxID=331697 RepID=UPI0013142EC6|nr:hypothetical protein [Chitinophaga skermanii]